MVSDDDAASSSSSWSPLLSSLQHLLSLAYASTSPQHDFDIESSNSIHEERLSAAAAGMSSLPLSRKLLHGRELRATIIDNPTFKWTLVALGGFIVLLTIACIIMGIVWCCIKDQNKGRGGGGEGSKVDPHRGGAAIAPAPAMKGMNGQPGAPQPPSYLTGGSPAPPWEQGGALPPGAVLNSHPPAVFTPFVSNPRPLGSNAYERMVLISSLVHNPMQIATSVLPNVAVVVYDWKNFTFQELARYMKKAIGTNKVTSIAVIAPGSKPGCVGLLENQTTSADKIKTKGEMAQFWRVVAGCVQTAAGGYDGRRVDLLGCRVVEAPREGAALLKELWALTSVPFAASDDALSGYQLATFLEEPNTGSLSLISSTIQAIDLYFDRYKLLGQEPPANAATLPPVHVPSAPLPPGPPPPGALNPNVMAGAAVGAGAAGAMTRSAVPPPPPPPPPPPANGGDIFQRFKSGATAKNIALLDLFKMFALKDPSALQPDEVDRMILSVVPDATVTDISHFKEMMDTNGDKKISREEFIQLLDKSLATSQLVDQPRKENQQLMTDLLGYIDQNAPSVKDYFVKPPKIDGRLDHNQIAEMVKLDISDLSPDESKYILAYFYKYTSKSSDGKMSFAEMRQSVVDHNK